MVRVEYLAWKVRADVGERANTRAISPPTFRSTCRIGDTQGNQPPRTEATLTSENSVYETVWKLRRGSNSWSRETAERG